MKNSKKLKSVALFVLIVLQAAALLACSKADTTQGQSGTNESATEGQREKGSLIVSMDWPLYIDPAVGSKGSDSVAVLNMYDTLTFPNSDGTISPNVAESWDVSDDAMVYTFHLRDDVKFHSGNPLTASDIKYSMDRLMTIGEGFAYIFSGVVKDVTVIDDKTVQFNLNVPSGTLPGMLIRLYILDEKAVKEYTEASGDYGDNGDYGKKWLLTNDAGSGPYQVREMKTEEYLVMERYDDYWKGWEEGTPESVKLVGGLEETAQRTMISRGELDISSDALTEDTYNAMDNMNDVDVIRSLSGVNVNLMLNTKLAPTDDIHVRKAMVYAVDYDTIVNDIYVGSNKSTGPVVAGMTAAALSESDMPYKLDKEKAMEELKQSPYYDQLINGEMTINFTYCTEGGEQQKKLALLIQSEMAELGVTVEITGKTFATMMTDADAVDTTPNASIVAFAPSYLDAGSILKTRYSSSSTGSWEQMEWLQDSEIDALIDDALITVDEQERNNKYKEIEKKLIDLCPTIWLFDAASTMAYRSSYIKVWPSIDMYNAGEQFIYSMGYGNYFRDFRLAE